MVLEKNKITVFLTSMILPFIGIVSCEMGKELDAEKYLPEHEMLVVHGFINPQDSAVIIAVSKSDALSSEMDTLLYQNLMVKDADVYISDGTNTEKLEFFILDSIRNPATSSIMTPIEKHWPVSAYSVPAEVFPIVAGKTYTLDVSTPDGLKASATCTVPADKGLDFTMTLEDVTRETTYCYEQSFDNGSYTVTDSCTIMPYQAYEAAIGWKDDETTEDYYYVEYPTIYPRYVLWQDTLLTLSAIWGQKEDRFFSDKELSGETIQIWTRVGINGSSWIGPKLEVDFVILDRPLFKYYESRERYRRQTENGTIILYDPPILYSNVVGGRGVFGAYNYKKLEFLF